MTSSNSLDWGYWADSVLESDNEEKHAWVALHMAIDSIGHRESGWLCGIGFPGK